MGANQQKSSTTTKKKAITSEISNSDNYLLPEANKLNMQTQKENQESPEMPLYLTQSQTLNIPKFKLTKSGKLDLTQFESYVNLIIIDAGSSLMKVGYASKLVIDVSDMIDISYSLKESAKDINNEILVQIPSCIEELRDRHKELQAPSLHLSKENQSVLEEIRGEESCNEENSLENNVQNLLTNTINVGKLTNLTSKLF